MKVGRPTSALARIPESLETGVEQRRRRPQTAPIRTQFELERDAPLHGSSNHAEWEAPSGAEALAKALWLHQERLLVGLPSQAHFLESLHSPADTSEILAQSLDETLHRSKETVSQSRDVCAAFAELWERIHEGEVQIESMRHELYEERDAHNLTKEQLIEKQAACRMADRKADTLLKRAHTAEAMYEDARRSLEAAVDATDASQVAEEVCARTARELEDHAMHVATNIDAAGKAGRQAAMPDVDVSAMQAELYELHEEREKTRQSLEEAAWRAAEALEVQQRLDDTLTCLADARKKLGNASQALLKREGHIMELRLLLAERESQNADLQRTVEDGKGQEIQMSNEIEHLRTRSNELQQQVAEFANAQRKLLDVDSEAKMREAVWLKEELTRRQAEAENLQEQLRLKEDSEQKALADKDTLVSRLRAHLEDMQRLCCDEQRLRHVAEDDLAALRAELEDMRQRCETETSALRQQLASQERLAKTQSKEGVLTALRAELADVQQRHETETAMLRAQLAEALSTSQAELTALRTELAESQQQSEADKQLAIIQSRAHEVSQAELTALRAELADLQRQRAAEEQLAKALSQAHEVAKADLTALRAELADLQRQREAEEQLAKAQSQTHEVAKAELIALRAELADLQRQREAELAGLREDLEDLRKQHQADKQRAQEAAEAELAALRAQLEQSQRRAEFDEQLAKLQSKDEMVAALRGELVDLQRQRESEVSAQESLVATLRAELADLQQQRAAEVSDLRKQLAEAPSKDDLAALRAQLLDAQRHREEETAVLREQLATLELHVQEDIEDQRDRRKISSFVAREEAAEVLRAAYMAQAQSKCHILQVKLRQWLSRTLVAEGLLIQAQAFDEWAKVAMSVKLQSLLSKRISLDKVASHVTSNARAKVVANFCSIWRNHVEQTKRKNAKREQSFARAMRRLARSDTLLKAQIFRAWAVLAYGAKERCRKMQAFEKHFGLTDLTAQCCVLSAWHSVARAERRRRTVKERCMSMVNRKKQEHMQLLHSWILLTWFHLLRVGRMQGELSECHRKQDELLQNLEECKAAITSSGFEALLRMAHKRALQRLDKQFVAEHEVLLSMCLGRWREMCLLRRRKDSRLQTCEIVLSARYKLPHVDLFNAWCMFAMISRILKRLKDSGMKSAAKTIASGSAFLCHEVLAQWLDMTVRFRQVRKAKRASMEKVARMAVSSCLSMMRFCVECWALLLVECRKKEKSYQRACRIIAGNAASLTNTYFIRWSNEHHKRKRKDFNHRRATWIIAVLGEMLQATFFAAWAKAWARKKTSAHLKEQNTAKVLHMATKEDAALMTTVLVMWTNEAQKIKEERLQAYQKDYMEEALENLRKELSEKSSLYQAAHADAEDALKALRRRAEYSCSLWNASLGRQVLVHNQAVMNEVFQTWRGHQLQEKRMRRAEYNRSLSASALGRQTLLLNEAIQTEVLQAWREHQLHEKRRRQIECNRSLLCTALERQFSLHSQALQSDVFQAWRQAQLQERRRHRIGYNRALVCADLERHSRRLDEAIQSDVLQAWRWGQLQEKHRRRDEYHRALACAALGRLSRLLDEAILSEVFQMWRRDVLQEAFRSRAECSRSLSCAALERQILLLNQCVQGEVFMIWRQCIDDALVQRARKEQGFSCAQRHIHNVSERVLTKCLSAWRLSARLSVSSQKHMHTLSRGIEAQLSKQFKRFCVALLRDWHATAVEMCMRGSRKDVHLAAVANFLSAREVAYLAVHFLSWTTAVLQARIADQAESERLRGELSSSQIRIEDLKEESERLRAELSSAQVRIEDLERRLLAKQKASQTEFETELKARNSELEELLKRYRVGESEAQAEQKRRMSRKFQIASALKRQTVTEGATMKHTCLRCWRQAVIDLHEVKELNARNILQTKRYASAMVRRVETKFLHIWACAKKACIHSRKLRRAMEAQYRMQQRQVMGTVFVLFCAVLRSSIVQRQQTVIEDERIQHERHVRERALSTNLSESEAERDRLLAELERARKEAIQLQDSLTESHGQQVQLSEQLQELRYVKARLEGELSMLKERDCLFHDAVEMSKQATARLVATEERLGKIQSELDDVRRLRDIFQRERDEFKKQLALADIEIERQRTEGEVVKKQLGEAKVLLERLRLQDATDLLRDARDIQEVETRLKAMLGVATLTFGRSQDEEATLVGWLRRERDDCRNRLEQAERCCSELHETVRKRDRQIMSLTSELNQLRSHARSGALRKSQDALGLQANMALLWLVFRSWMALVLRSRIASRSSTPLPEDEFSLVEWQNDTPTSRSSLQESGTMYGSQSRQVPQRPSSGPGSVAPRRRNISVSESSTMRPASAFTARPPQVSAFRGRRSVGANIGRGKLIQQLADCSRWVGSDPASAVSTRVGTPDLHGVRLGSRPSTAGGL